MRCSLAEKGSKMANGDIYRKRECDLCDAFAYEKHLGTSEVLDGGFTRIEDWEPSGFGSLVINFWETKGLQHNRIEKKLCPACAMKMDRAICEAIRKIKEESKNGK